MVPQSPQDAADAEGAQIATSWLGTRVALRRSLRKVARPGRSARATGGRRCVRPHEEDPLLLRERPAALVAGPRDRYEHAEAPDARSLVCARRYTRTPSFPTPRSFPLASRSRSRETARAAGRRCAGRERRRHGNATGFEARTAKRAGLKQATRLAFQRTNPRAQAGDRARRPIWLALRSTFAGRCRELQRSRRGECTSSSRPVSNAGAHRRSSGAP